jgi:hypothetical protein
MNSSFTQFRVLVYFIYLGGGWKGFANPALFSLSPFPAFFILISLVACPQLAQY